jgi:tRNA threonylcarbamoyl adenosine modification protein (Sua5/YciO/YrdC/YwlC family)
VPLVNTEDFYLKFEQMHTKIAKKNLNLVNEITRHLKDGEIIILPTDTVYAFVGNAFDTDAVAKISSLKHWGHPQPMTIFTRKEKASEVVVLNRQAELMMSYFPYPVTMILPAKKSLPPQVTNGFKNVFVACPDRFIYDLVDALPFPMVCATVSVGDGIKVSDFNTVVQFYGDKVPFIVDGGRSKHGRSGTLVDFTLEIPTIMNFGTVSVDDLRPMIPEIILPSHLMK